MLFIPIILNNTVLNFHPSYDVSWMHCIIFPPLHVLASLESFPSKTLLDCKLISLLFESILLSEYNYNLFYFWRYYWWRDNFYNYFYVLPFFADVICEREGISVIIYFLQGLLNGAQYQTAFWSIRWITKKIPWQRKLFLWRFHDHLL